MSREITACIYRKGVEKPVVKWSFMSSIPSIQKDQSESSLKTFICELKTKHGLSSRFENKYVQSFSHLQTNNCRTRLSNIAVDSQEQFFVALDFAAFLVFPSFPTFS